MKKLTIDKSLNIKGWMSVEELVFLAKCASECSLVVEVGSYYGRSARTLADNMKENGILYCIDPWNGPVYDKDGNQMYNVNEYVYRTFKENLQPYITEGRVIPIRGTLENHVFLYDSVDFMFLDGDHEYNSIKSDIELALNVVKPNGIIAGHDYDPQWPDVMRAVNEFFPIAERIGTIWHIRKSSLDYPQRNLQDAQTSMII